ncbi:ABC transporter C family member 10-like [Ziziphus jujuba]|uniref:ABC-type xenobiotic transporter n=1 Tax=Ziziphus jujuba TaxID=326968 RepID=A0ABM3IDT3_ZIZJJ|nr:ABC transporter C family member 10-like [Ziziphus jujuba]
MVEWTAICAESGCSETNACINHALIICFDALLLVVLIFTLLIQNSSSSKKVRIPARFRGLSNLQIVSATLNTCIGLVYLFLGIWILEEKLRKTQTALFLISLWFQTIFQGFTWLLVGLTVSIRIKHLPKLPVRLLSILAFLFSGFVCVLSVFTAILSKDVSLKIALDVLSFPGAILLLLCAYRGCKNEENEQRGIQNGLFTSLNGEANGVIEIDPVTPFAKAGTLSRFSFWWLNSLMKRGREKTLEDEHIPKLSEADTAESCYLLFLEQLDKQKRADPSSQPSVLKTIILCHLKEIFVSGFFALVKTIATSAGPLLLNAFILVAEGKESFKYEGYVLAISLFLTKCIESLSQRQWYFRTRLIGMKVKSLLTAAIFKKQMRLSNAARLMHSSGEIMNYVTVDAYRIGEFPFWFHQIWTTSLQLCISLVILYQAVGLATIAALVCIILTVICNAPLAKLQHKFQTKLMVAQDDRLKASSEALVNMKVLKLYAWETHIKGVIEKLRNEEYKWLSSFQLRRAYNIILFWLSPVLVSAVTFSTCYFLNVPLHANNVFTFVATLRLVQDPISAIPDVLAAIIQAKVSLARIVNFLEEPELQSQSVRIKCNLENVNHNVIINSADFSWEENLAKPSLRNIDLQIACGDKVAVCGEVGSGKSTLLASILGEVPNVRGHIQVYGKIAYVSQTAWIQTGTVQDNILFGSAMDGQRYHETLERCSLVKDLDLLPYGDLTEIGERGVNFSGGQKQRIQLARALYQNADLYLLDDPFSAVDAHTAKSLFNEYVMEALSGKTVVLVTHQVDFLPAFDSVLLMSDGEILRAAPYHQLLSLSLEFQDLVNAHKNTAGSERLEDITPSLAKNHGTLSATEIQKSFAENQFKPLKGDQLIKHEEREVGDIGLKPYKQYLKQNKGFLYFSVSMLSHLIFVACQIAQSSWMAANVDNPHVSSLMLIMVYLVIGFASIIFVVLRSLYVVVLGVQSSKSLFSQLQNSLFNAPMSFYDSTPLGRILSRVSLDLSIVDIDIPFSLTFAVGAFMVAVGNLGVVGVVTWQVLFVSVPTIFLALRLQGYYFSAAKELMRINGTTKSLVANHLAESLAGVVTIRAFEEEERFFRKNLDLIDINTSPFFHNFAANEWLIQRLEILCAIVLASSALCIALLPPETYSSGFIGMAISYGISLNGSLVFSIQNQCILANYIISVERLNQYMYIPSEAPHVIEQNRPPANWPAVGKVELHDLQIRYRPNAPLVLHGISCTFVGGNKIGIVGRTGSGKTTLIGALFRLVEPAGGKIIVDGIDICTIGLHDLRSRFGIIPQDPTLFNGTVRYNLDPLSQHSDEEIWEVLGKCQLQEAVQEKKDGLDSLVVDDGSNWSLGQKQLFCLGRALLRRSRILVLDEATASIDNATDMILQTTIRNEFADCTVITVAHRIPTVMDCAMVLGINDGKLVEYDEPAMLMKREGSLFGKLVKEYWSHFQSAEININSSI